MVNEKVRQKILTKFAEDLEGFNKSEINTLIDSGYMCTQYESSGSIDFHKYLIELFRENYDLEKTDYNNYLEDNNLEMFYSMDEFNEIMSYDEPYTIAKKVFYGKFYPSDKYFTFDNNGNLESFNYLDREYDEEDVIDYIVDNYGSEYEELEFASDNKDLIIDIARFLVEEGY